MYLGEKAINDYLYIPANTHQFSTGSKMDASVITYRIYEEESQTEIITATTMTKFNSQSGFYYDRKQLTRAAGFDPGKDYVVLILATVDGVSASASHTFRIRTAAEEGAAIAPVHITTVAS